MRLKYFCRSVPLLLIVLSGQLIAGTVSLVWIANTEGDLAGYRVYRTQTSGTGYVLLNASLVTSPSFADTTATAGNTFYYAVTAVNTSGQESQKSAEVAATVTAAAQTSTLTVSKSGTGTGIVNSNPAGINCGPTCSAQFASNTIVTLTASPATGATFVGWSGAGCSGTAACQVTMNQARSVTASFSSAAGWSWTTGAGIPTARIASTAAVGVLRNKITIIGDREAGVGTGRLNQEYDPSTNSWKSKTAYPRTDGRFNLNSNAVVGDRMYLFGGTNIGNSYNTRSVDAYNPVTDTWLLDVAQYPVTVAGVSTAVFNDFVFCFGGQDFNRVAYRLAYRFDPAQRTFTPLASPPTGRINARSFVHGDSIWFAGGVNLTPGLTVLDTTDIYDPASNTWTPGPHLPRSDKVLSWLGKLVDGQIYAVYSDTSPVVYRYRPASADWEQVGQAPMLQDYFAVAAVSARLVTLGGGSPPVSTVQVFAVTNPIFTNVTRYYQTVLGRQPEPGEAEYWTEETERLAGLGIDLREGFQAAAKIFFNSQEYGLKNRTDDEFVGDLYQTFLNRAAEPAGKAFWIDYLHQGLTRVMLITQFAYSQEFSQLLEGIFGDSACRPENNLLNDLYRGFLGRFPDSAGFDSSLAQLREAQCQGPQAVVSLVNSITLGFIQSQEYALRQPSDAQFIEDLYNGILRRGADPAGFVSWVNQLKTRSRAEVLAEFINSAEFQSRVQEIIDAGCRP